MKLSQVRKITEMTCDQTDTDQRKVQAEPKHILKMVSKFHFLQILKTAAIDFGPAELTKPLVVCPIKKGPKI